MLDGTVIWTSPTGRTYTTYPGSKHLFPKLCEPTATLWTGEPPITNTTGERGVMKPKRRYTRAHNTTKAINAERRLYETYRATVSELVHAIYHGLPERRAPTTHHPSE